MAKAQQIAASTRRPAAAKAPVAVAKSGSADRRERIKASIFEAAVQEFALYGLKGASTQGIAEHAGLSKAQLHYYIESKEALYEEVIQAVTSEWFSVFESTRTYKEPAAAIAGLVRRKLEYSFDFPAQSRLFATEIMAGGHYVRKHWDKAKTSRQRGLALIAGWMDDGLIVRMDPILLLFHIWSLTQHYADYEVQARYLLHLGPEAPFDRAHIVREVASFVLRGCGFSASAIAAALARVDGDAAATARRLRGADAA